MVRFISCTIGDVKIYDFLFFDDSRQIEDRELWTDEPPIADTVDVYFVDNITWQNSNRKHFKIFKRLRLFANPT